jgi:hypothetical protein
MRPNAILSALSVFLARILFLVISVISEGLIFSSHPPKKRLQKDHLSPMYLQVPQRQQRQKRQQRQQRQLR